MQILVKILLVRDAEKAHQRQQTGARLRKHFLSRRPIGASRGVDRIIRQRVAIDLYQVFCIGTVQCATAKQTHGERQRAFPHCPRVPCAGRTQAALCRLPAAGSKHEAPWLHGVLERGDYSFEQVLAGNGTGRCPAHEECLHRGSIADHREQAAARLDLLQPGIG